MAHRRTSLPVPGPGVAGARRYCRAMLPCVSRTFALNIRVLPGALGEAVLLGYLFCRIADTVEDTPALEAAAKPQLLEQYSRLFPLGEGWEARVDAWARTFVPLDAAEPDHALCRDAAAVFRAFAALPPRLREPVEACVREMALGMASFARQRAASSDRSLHLETWAELERYCHYVAGTVGEMLWRLFALSSPTLDPERLERMRPLAERFGLAMQLTNIVKDVAEDARRGAFYVPRALAARHDLEPEALLDPARRSAARAVVAEMVAVAAGALDAAVAFTLLIPRREARLRLFCLWPIFLAARTLQRVREDDGLFVPGTRVRISRGELRRCLSQTTLAALSNRAVRAQYGRIRNALGAEPARSS